jgi:hypothetical protein
MAQDIIAAGADPAPRHDPLDLDGILPPELGFTPVTTKSGRQKFLPELQLVARDFVRHLLLKLVPCRPYQRLQVEFQPFR